MTDYRRRGGGGGSSLTATQTLQLANLPLAGQTGGSIPPGEQRTIDGKVYQNNGATAYPLVGSPVDVSGLTDESAGGGSESTFGPTVPSNAVGVDGDVHTIDDTAPAADVGKRYKKTAGVWALTYTPPLLTHHRSTFGPTIPLPTEGNDDDVHTIDNTGAASEVGKRYKKTAGVWVLEFTPDPGITVHFGTGAPLAPLGADDDTYHDTVTGDVWNKVGGTWTQEVDVAATERPTIVLLGSGTLDWPNDYYLSTAGTMTLPSSATAPVGVVNPEIQINVAKDYSWATHEDTTVWDSGADAMDVSGLPRTGSDRAWAIWDTTASEWFFRSSSGGETIVATTSGAEEVTLSLIADTDFVVPHSVAAPTDVEVFDSTGNKITDTLGLVSIVGPIVTLKSSASLANLRVVISP